MAPSRTRSHSRASGEEDKDPLLTQELPQPGVWKRFLVDVRMKTWKWGNDCPSYLLASLRPKKKTSANHNGSQELRKHVLHEIGSPGFKVRLRRSWRPPETTRHDISLSWALSLGGASHALCVFIDVLARVLLLFSCLQDIRASSPLFLVWGRLCGQKLVPESEVLVVALELIWQLFEHPLYGNTTGFEPRFLYLETKVGIDDLWHSLLQNIVPGVLTSHQPPFISPISP